MKLYSLVLSAYFLIASVGAITASSFARADEDAIPAHEPHDYNPYEKQILKNVSEFHKHFDAHEWDKNAPLVAENIHLDSNGAQLQGRDVFVKRIARFVGPFPDIKITDLVTTVDGNVAVVRFTLTGTHEGDLETPEGVLHPTHKHFKVDGVEVFTFDKEAKVTDLLSVEDLAGLMRQLKSKK